MESKFSTGMPSVLVRCDDGALLDSKQRRDSRVWRFYAFVLGAMAFFCACCFFVTLSNTAEISALKNQLERLRNETKHSDSEFGENKRLPPSTAFLDDSADDADDDDDDDAEDIEEYDVIASLEQSQRHVVKRQASDKKKPPAAANKKQPAAKSVSAIHLYLNVRNATADEKQRIERGEVVTLIYGNLSKLGFQPKRERHHGEETLIYKPWKTADWASDTKDYQFSAETGAVTVQKKGLYFIYSQILYHTSATRSSYVIMVDREILAKCMVSVDAIMPGSNSSTDSARYKTCYVASTRLLNKGQSVWIQDLYSRHVTVDPKANFFGLVKLADVGK